MDSKTAASDAHHHHPRVEDDMLVRGAGHFVADRPEPDQAYAWFARSPHAFARIRSIDVEAARSAPGVLAVLTGADMDAAGVGNVGRHPPLTGRGGAKMAMPRRPAIAHDQVRYVGEAVAIVVAETAVAAQDAAELIAVDYEEMTPVTERARRWRPGRRSCGPRRPAISASIGSVMRRIPRPTRVRSTRSSAPPSSSPAWR